MATQILEIVQREAGRVLDMVRTEMARRERDLESLREQLIRWRAALGVAAGAAESAARHPNPVKAKASVRARPALKRGRPVRRAKVDWDGVLERLPKRFTAADLEKRVPSIAKDPRARARALARWTRARKIKKGRDGKYQRG